jgi:hypothetical protein
MSLVEKMLKIADNGFRNCEDDSCIHIFGLIRDYGYKIRKTVEQEQLADQKRDGCIKAFQYGRLPCGDPALSAKLPLRD